MRELIIVRHAKAGSAPGKSDHARPLSDEGQQQAREVGTWLSERDCVPHAIVSSTAERALSTAAGLVSASGFEGILRVTRELYESDATKYCDVVRRLRSDAERLLLVGHNPSLEELLERLVGAPHPLGTASVARVRVDIESWEELDVDGPASLAELWRPIGPG